MFKKFSSVIFAMVLSLGIFSNAEAADVQIYDGGVGNIVKVIEQFCNGWGTEYYTYQGVKRCEAHFGNSDKNLVRFRLNNDNSVSRFLITMPTDSINNTSDSANAGVIMGVILGAVGLEKSELVNLWTKFTNGLENATYSNPYATHFHEKYSVWCSRTLRYVVMDVEVDNNKTDFYFYAYK